MPKLNDFAAFVAKFFDHSNDINERKKTVDEILTEFVAKTVLGNGSENLARALRDEGLMDLNNGAWDDDYDILGYLPPCPKCKAKMRYNDGADLLQCPECGYTVVGMDYPYHDMPSWDEISEDDYRK